MRRIYAAAATAALLLAACADASQAPVAPDEALFARGVGSLNFTTVEVPGATATTAWGIGPGGDIVGSYVSGGVVRGFLLRRGDFTTIEFPGAAFTIARGIAPNGDIVGQFRFPGEAPPTDRGFVRSANGEYREIAVEGYKNLIPQRILPDGTIAGCVHDDDYVASMKGFLMGPDAVQVDEIFASMHNGATPSGRRVVGLYMNEAAERDEGYILDDGVFTSLLVPGSNWTQAWDVNPTGNVVGLYRLAGPPVTFQGFLLNRDGYTTIHFPGADHTRAFGINPAGDIVGNYVMDGVTRGFVASRTGRPTR
jgi:hypothetical protein